MSLNANVPQIVDSGNLNMNIDDGEVYTQIRELSVIGADRARERECWSRLSSYHQKYKNLKVLLKKVQFVAALDVQIHIPGLRSGMRLSTWHKIFNQKCDEEHLHHLHHVRDFWLEACGHNRELMAKIDRPTVKAFEATAPGASEEDEQRLKSLLKCDHICTALNESEKSVFWANMLSMTTERLVPSLYTYFENTKYFEGPAECVKNLIHIESGRTVFSTLREANFIGTFANPVRTRDNAYRRFWISAMRNYYTIGPRKNTNNKVLAKSPFKANDAALRDLAIDAQHQGFRTSRIIELASSPPDQQIIENALQEARDPDRYIYDHTVVEFFHRTADKQNTGSFVNRAVKFEHRTGVPTIEDHELCKPHMSFENFHSTQTHKSHIISPLFVRRSVYLAFWGRANLFPEDTISEEIHHLSSHSLVLNQDLAVDDSSQGEQTSSRNATSSRSFRDLNNSTQNVDLTQNIVSDERDRLASDVAAARDKIRDLEADKQDLETARQQDKEAYKNLSQEMRDMHNALENEKKRILVERTELEKRRQEINQQLGQKQVECQDVQTELLKAKQTLEQEQKRLEEMQQEITTLRYEKDQQCTILTRGQSKVVELEQELTTLRYEKDQQCNTLTREQSKVVELEQELTTLRYEKDQQCTILTREQSTVVELEQELNQVWTERKLSFNQKQERLEELRIEYERTQSDLQQTEIEFTGIPDEKQKELEPKRDKLITRTQWLKNRIQELKKSINRELEKITQKDQQNILEGKVKELEKICDKKDQKLKQIQTELQETQNGLATTSSQKEDKLRAIKQELIVLQNERNQQYNELRQKHIDFKTLEGALDKERASFKQAQEELINMKKAFEKTQRQEVQQRNGLEQKQIEFQDVQRELLKAKQTLEQEQTRLEDTQQELTTLRYERDQQCTTLGREQSKVAELEQELDQIWTERELPFEPKKERLEELRIEHERIQSILSQRSIEFSRLPDKEKKQLELSQDKLTIKEQRLNNRIQELEKSVNEEIERIIQEELLRGCQERLQKTENILEKTQKELERRGKNKKQQQAKFNEELIALKDNADQQELTFKKFMGDLDTITQERTALATEVQQLKTAQNEKDQELKQQKIELEKTRGALKKNRVTLLQKERKAEEVETKLQRILWNDGETEAPGLPKKRKIPPTRKNLTDAQESLISMPDGDTQAPQFGGRRLNPLKRQERPTTILDFERLNEDQPPLPAPEILE